MDFDFALLLVVLTAVTGVIALLDRLFWMPRRKARSAALAQAEGSDAERQQRAQEALREPIIVEYARSFFPVILIVLLFRSFLAEPFKIPSGSMKPTLLVGDFILVNKFAYGLRLPVLGTKIVAIGEPKRGDVFVFRYPGFGCQRNDQLVRSGKPCEFPIAPVPQLDYIKRVIGLPGDEITYRNKTLYVNGKEMAQADVGPFVGPEAGEIHQEVLPEVTHDILQMPMRAGVEGSWKVPAGHYFAMGDNRDNSEDSRYWGFVPEQNVIGKAFVIWMNWDGGVDFKRIGTLIN
jgi:signal peptidase I